MTSHPTSRSCVAFSKASACESRPQGNDRLPRAAAAGDPAAIKVLPPPQKTDAVIANNPAWPKDPDVKRAAKPRSKRKRA